MVQDSVVVIRDYYCNPDDVASNARYVLFLNFDCTFSKRAIGTSLQTKRQLRVAT